MTRLRAFTIVEVIVNVVIMSLIVGFVYFIYVSFGNQFSNYQRQMEVGFGYKNFVSALRHDLYASSLVIGSNSDIEVLFYDGSKTNYYFREGFFYRKKGEVVDSIATKAVEVWYTENETYLNQELIEKVVIEFADKRSANSYSLTKYYPFLQSNF